ncbi:transglutaminase TgpA family protein [Blastococcus sp. SYSU DS0617]
MSRTDVRTPVAAAAATLLGALALSPVLSSGTWVRPAVDAILVVLLTGLALRSAGQAIAARAFPRRPVPVPLAALGTALVPAGQLAALTGYLIARFTSPGGILALVPTPGGIEALLAVLRDGADEIREQTAPAVPVAALMALIALFVGLVAVIVDLLAVGGRQAAFAGPTLLVLFGVPVFTLGGDIGLLPVVGPAAGLALLLWADQSRQLDTAARSGRHYAGGGTAVRIGLVAVLVGVLGGGMVPTLAEGSLSGGPGGSGSTGTSLDPVASMVGELTRNNPVDLLRVETAVPDPGYLRSVTVDRYDAAAGWSLGAPGALLPLDAQLPRTHDETAARPVTARIEALGHDDRFLPVPVSPVQVRLGGDGDDWRYDPITGTVAGSGVTSEDRVYEATASEVRPTPEQLAEAPPLRPGDLQERFLALPPLDPRVTAQVEELVGGIEGGYARVRAVLDFLTDPASGFTYALSTPPGTSGDDLVDFLTERRGYCEQYAGAMAVMVRAAGMPARVALGYTPGTVQDDGSRLITSDDAHAWVEVYFDGLGWVPFDPTPIDVDRRAELPWAPRVAAEELPEQTPELPALPPDLALLDPVSPLGPDLGPTDPATTDAAPADEASWPVRGALVLLVAAVAALPAGLRLLQRRRRLALGTAGALWDELIATADDLGVPRDPSWTPREAGRALAERTAGSPGAEAIQRLARAEEVSSYGPVPDAQDDGLVAELRTARRELVEGAGRRARWRAAFWPASLPAAVRAALPAWAVRRPVLPGPWRGSRRA